MTPQELKNSILQLAIQGKLVEQRPEEGTAEELYKQIQAEKQKLIKEGKIKRDKELPAIKEDEIPFDIPDTWRWIKFGDVTDFHMGKTPPRAESQWWKKDVPWVSIADMPEGGIITETKEHVSFESIKKKFGGKIVQKDTLLMSFKLTVGRVSILGIDAVHNEAIISIYPFVDDSFAARNFLFHVLPFMSSYGETKSAIKGRTLNKDSLNNLLIPLPPLEEQKRIVAKIEELLPYIDKYEEAWTKLENLNKKFPDDMQKSILQMAIQGKLTSKSCDFVEQQGKPFPIPEHWEWIKASDLGRMVRGSGIKRGEVTEIGKPCIRYGQLYTTYKNKIIEIESHIPEALFDKCKHAQCGDVLMSLTGENEYDIALAKPYCGVEIIAIGGDMTTWTEHGQNNLYLSFVMNSPYGITCKSQLATGNIIVHISNDKLGSIDIPVPPLEEQNIIVKVVEELSVLCDKLK